MTATRPTAALETYSGLYVDLLNPDPETICLEDIAVGLSNICRFGGQVSRFYSVAEHSVRCAEAARWDVWRLPALMHDAHEAYTNDIPTPVKSVLGVELAALQRRLDAAIGAAFGIDPEKFLHRCVKDADAALLYREAAGLKYSHGRGDHWGNHKHYKPLVAYGWSPAEAEQRFIDTYRRLTNATS